MASINFNRLYIVAAIAWVLFSALVMWGASYNDRPFDMDGEEMDIVLGTIAMASPLWLVAAYQWITSRTSLPKAGIAAYGVFLIWFGYVWCYNANEAWPLIYTAGMAAMVFVFQWIERKRAI